MNILAAVDNVITQYTGFSAMEYYDRIKGLLIDGFQQFMETLGGFFPNLLTAVTLLLVGLIIAWLAKWFTQRLGSGLDRMLHTVGFTSFQLRLKWSLADILGWVAYWLIILFFLTVAVDSLGLPDLADWLGRLFRHLPALLVAVVFVLAGFYGGNLLRDRIREGAFTAGLQQANLLAGWARVIVILFAVILAMTQIGINVELFENVLIILVTTFLGSLALAFGLGAGPTVGNIIAARYLRNTYQPGQEIRINEIRGRILELTTTGVLLDTEEGRTFIPARIFEQYASELLDNDSVNES